jgi:hypothetical protein
MSTTHDLSTAMWRKSSYSNGEGGACVEVATNFPGAMPVRDSKCTEGPVLALTVAAWASFVTAIKVGSL